MVYTCNINGCSLRYSWHFCSTRNKRISGICFLKAVRFMDSLLREVNIYTRKQALWEYGACPWQTVNGLTITSFIVFTVRTDCLHSQCQTVTRGGTMVSIVMPSYMSLLPLHVKNTHALTHLAGIYVRALLICQRSIIPPDFLAPQLIC